MFAGGCVSSFHLQAYSARRRPLRPWLESTEARLPDLIAKNKLHEALNKAAR
jgi:hypothetical protein